MSIGGTSPEVGDHQWLFEETFKPSDARILEVGCETGGNLALLMGYGHLSALEMDATALNIAKGTVGGDKVDIRQGALPGRDPFAGKVFDLIILLDVLEHIKDDGGTLSELHRCTAAGGKIVITVPGYNWLFGRHDVALHHMRRYGKRELTRRVETAGFRVRRATYFNTFLFPLVALSRLWEKMSTGEKIIGQHTPPKPLNTVLKAVFRERGGSCFRDSPSLSGFLYSVLLSGKLVESRNKYPSAFCSPLTSR